MKLLLTTTGRYYRTADGAYWTSVVHDYNFFMRYLEVFDQVKLIAHTENRSFEDVHGMLRVDGKNLEIFEVPFPHGKIEYIKQYIDINNTLKRAYIDCDVCILRIPDQLAFQVYSVIRDKNIPIAVEVTSDSWVFFAKGSTKSILRPFLRLIWHFKQKQICAKAVGTSYVTEYGLQKRYPPKRAIMADGFTTHYTSANIDDSYYLSPRQYSSSKDKPFTIIHISAHLANRAKGYLELIKAFSALLDKGYDIKLVLVGEGNLSADVNEFVSKKNIRSKICFTGRLNLKDEIINELKNSDMFVLPSYREGLPRVIIEAMATGLPCIASDLPGTRELLQSECLVKVKSNTQLKFKIEYLLKNTNKMEEFSQQNYNKSYRYKYENVSRNRKAFYLRVKQIGLSNALNRDV